MRECIRVLLRRVRGEVRGRLPVFAAGEVTLTCRVKVISNAFVDAAKFEAFLWNIAKLISFLLNTINSTQFTTYFWKSTYLHLKRSIECKKKRTFLTIFFLFLKKAFFFANQLSCSRPLATLEKRRNIFSNNHICILHSLCGNLIIWLLYTINTIFHMNKVVFQTLWKTIWLFLWGVPHILPARCKLMRNTFFEKTTRGVLFVKSSQLLNECVFFYKNQLYGVEMIHLYTHIFY